MGCRFGEMPALDSGTHGDLRMETAPDVGSHGSKPVAGRIYRRACKLQQAAPATALAAERSIKNRMMLRFSEVCRTGWPPSASQGWRRPRRTRAIQLQMPSISAERVAPGRGNSARTAPVRPRRHLPQAEEGNIRGWSLYGLPR